MGCKKGDPPVHATIPTMSYEYFVFKKGSYWIYKESEMNIIDSAFLISDPIYSNDESYLNADGSGTIYDNAELDFSSNFIGAFYLKSTSVIFYQHQRGYIMFMYPPDSYKYYYITLPPSIFETVAFYDTLTINNNLF